MTTYLMKVPREFLARSVSVGHLLENTSKSQNQIGTQPILKISIFLEVFFHGYRFTHSLIHTTGNSTEIDT